MRKSTHNKLRFGALFYNKMRQRKSLVWANLLVCAGIFLTGIIGSEFKFAITGMALVQSINVPMLYETYLEHKTNPAIQYEKEQPPKNRR